MKWQFFAKPGHLLPRLGQNRVGQVVRYCGRDSKIVDGQMTHRAKKEPMDIDPISELGLIVRRLFSIEDDAPLLCANEATAKALGVKFFELEYNEEAGEFLPKPVTKKDRA